MMQKTGKLQKMSNSSRKGLIAEDITKVLSSQSEEYIVERLKPYNDKLYNVIFLLIIVGLRLNAYELIFYVLQHSRAHNLMGFRFF